MTGERRKGHDGKKQRSEKKTDDKTHLIDASPTMKLFQMYQTELDVRYDKHERLIKKSRDLTIESKRIIFLLHRITSSGNKEEILKEAEDRLSSLFSTVINDIALELTHKREVYQYLKAFTAGLQEFVEAFSFYYYVKNGSLICLEEVYNPVFVASSEVSKNGFDSEKIRADLTLSTLLTPLDYVLGIGDLTGELMRKCINSVASGDIDEPFKLCYLLQSIYDGLLVCNNHSKDLKRKVYTLRSSLQKVENACYAIKIRGTEIPKHILADFFSNDDEYKDTVDCDL